MGIEIERKFLVDGDGWREGKSILMRQGYLCTDVARTVRVRIEGECAFLAIKGKTMGCTRCEFEYAIPVDEAYDLLQLCEGIIIEKQRYRVDYCGHIWEVDEFFGAHEGLLIAEIELASEGEVFEKPSWIGREVTGDARYYNSVLSDGEQTELIRDN